MGSGVEHGNGQRFPEALVNRPGSIKTVRHGLSRFRPGKIKSREIIPGSGIRHAS